MIPPSGCQGIRGLLVSDLKLVAPVGYITRVVGAGVIDQSDKAVGPSADDN